MSKTHVHDKHDYGHEYDEAYFKKVPKVLKDCHASNVIEILLDGNHNNRILEVGCGPGALMRLLRKKGYKHIQGIDISPVAAKLSGGIVASATKIPFPKQSFDTVIGLSIIEHLSLREADVFLQEAFRVLKPGGFVFLLTPNGASLLKLLKGKRWYGYDDHSHTYFFTPTTLKRTLLNAGFTHIRRTFRITIDTYDWPFPWFKDSSPMVRRFINMLWVSTPLAFFRDSIFISGTKPLRR